MCHARVPQSEDTLQVQLAHEEAVHPPERKVKEINVEFVQMIAQLGQDLAREALERKHLALDTFLSESEVILNAVEEAGEAEVAAGYADVKCK